MAVPTQSIVVRVALLSIILTSTTAAANAGGLTSARPANKKRHHLLAGPKNVTYDGRSLFINGKRELLYSGSIHYTRSTPEMWPDLLDKARHGGLNVIQTYVFWNAHEPEQGKYYFEGKYDVVKFIKLVQQKGMYVTLRLGPFIQAEWNHGGLPYWLREVPNIIFRSDNEPYKLHMKAFVLKVIQMMKDAKLFASQGGPIILAQIENEYNHVQLAYDSHGDSYIQWAANMAVATDIGIPWIMCKQKDAPDPIVNACNGRHCGDTFAGPNKPYKPVLWTENWTAQYRAFGDPISTRSVEDIAFSVARFFSKNGNLVNYYMYHGGTNFGRTSAAFTTTRYYDEAPLDEYGLQREPKWSHLRDAHRAVNLCKKALLAGRPSFQKLNENHEIRVYEKLGTPICSAFITNNHSKEAATIRFRGQDYFVPPHSISILPDCKTVVYNTQNIVAQHNHRTLKRSTLANNHKWEVYSESIPTNQQIPVDRQSPAELYSLLKDTSDNAWFTTSFMLTQEQLQTKDNQLPLLHIMSLGHSCLAFVNGEYVGSQHGTHDEKSFEFKTPAKFKVGLNTISILATTVGLPDSGAYMEHRYAGPKSIRIIGLRNGPVEVTNNGWGHRVGLEGEKLEIFTQEGSKKVHWTPAKGVGRALSWYKTNFATPEGRDPVAIRMSGMFKGMVYVNGQSIGRHWPGFLNPARKPSQADYHIPRSYLNPRDNLLVVMEEEPVIPDGMEILTVERDTICTIVAENYAPAVQSWESKNGTLVNTESSRSPIARVKCPNRKRIVAVDFASFGNPSGTCGAFAVGNCNLAGTKKVVEKACIGKESCAIPVDRAALTRKKARDLCPALLKTLAIQVRCSF